MGSKGMDFKHKEVINIIDGKRLGFVKDVNNFVNIGETIKVRILECDDDNFHVKLSIKNLQDMAVKQNSIADVTLVYNDKYKYDCFEVTEKDNGGDFQTFPNLYTIDPLKTLKYHFLVEVPKDVKNDKGSLKAIIKANGEEFEYAIR